MTQRRKRPAHGAPSRRKRLPSWRESTRPTRRGIVLTALASGLVVVAAIVAVVVMRSEETTTSAHLPSRALAADVPNTTAGAKWLGGSAGKILSAVTADQARLSTAVTAGKHGEAKSAGVQLATDAKAALGGPLPPAARRYYRSALKYFERAGAHAASGDLRKVSRLLAAGQADIAKVTAAANPVVPVNPPAQVNDLNG